MFQLLILLTSLINMYSLSQFTHKPQKHVTNLCFLFAFTDALPDSFNETLLVLKTTVAMGTGRSHSSIEMSPTENRQDRSHLA